MSNSQNRTKKKSFWTFWRTLPGIITAIATLIAAITGLILALKKPDITPKVDSYTIETKSLEVAPYSLKNSMGSQDFLYWFRVRVHNSGREPLHLAISFRVRQGPATANPEPARYTVNPGEKFSQNVDPAFEFLKDDVDAHLEVTWIIRDHKDSILNQGTKKILVLSKNILDWNLTTPEGKPVPKDFLIASLASWTLTPDPTVKERARQLLQGIESWSNPSLFARQWFARCYNELFHNSPGLKISSPLTFPMKGRQSIRMPSQVLTGRHADPLEGVLLLAALSRATFEKLGVRLVLFVLSEAEEVSSFLSWSAGGNDWHALDMAHVATMGFEKNEDLATSRVTKMLKEKPEIIRALETSGVFIEKGRLIIALDFATAAKQFRIRGLP